ncbi:MAG: hypothetical protein J6J36_05310 [Clostridia bacterium]|nr:hypothetical protein [Clostridia bacterium]
MNFNRINLHDCKKINSENNLQASDGSIIEEYYVPELGKKGLYKKNCFTGKNTDLRELLGSLILNSAGIRTANIQLTQDDNGKTGCLSMDILRDGEQFLENTTTFNSQDIRLPQLPIGIDNSIELDAYTYSALYPSIPIEFWQQRKEFFKKYIFISAFIGNTDIKSDNCRLIFDEKSGIVRNPDMYYDMSMAFCDSDTNYDGKSDIDIMMEMYQKYPESIQEVSKSLQKYLTRDYINGILNMPVFRSISEQDINKICNNIGRKMALITKQNELLYGIQPQDTSVLTSVKDIESIANKVSFQCHNDAKSYLNKIYQKMEGDNGNE